MKNRAVGPLEFYIERPERLSRSHLLLKTFLGWAYAGLPHGIILYFYGILAQLVTIVAFLAILFTGRYPRNLFDLVVGYHRWCARVNVYLLYYMTDRYPPFSPSDDPTYPVSLYVEYPDRLSRKHALLKFFLGWIYAGLPHGVLLLVYYVLAIVALFISWWAILFTGKFPEVFFGFIEGMQRWQLRLSVYLSLMSDEYPPFSGGSGR